MELPKEIHSQIYEFSKPLGLRADWRSGSNTAKAVRESLYWKDYHYDIEKAIRGLYTSYPGTIQMNPDSTWKEWCYSKMILSPIHWRSESDLIHAGMDEGYLLEAPLRERSMMDEARVAEYMSRMGDNWDTNVYIMAMS